jgi:putative transposase
MAASELSGSAARSRRQGPGSATELRWLYDRHSVEEARGDLARWLLRWQERHPKLCAWVEANIDETFAFYRLPREHYKHLKSTNMLERLNQEVTTPPEIAPI